MKIITASKVAFANDIGGTALMDGPVKVRVDTSWDDYETGTHYRGRLFLKEDIERANKKGTTGFTPDDLRKYPGVHQAVVKAAKDYDPAAVCVSEFDVIEVKEE